MNEKNDDNITDVAFEEIVENDAIITNELDGIDADDRRELTEEEKEEFFKKQVKEYNESKGNYSPVKYVGKSPYGKNGSITVCKFGTDYKNERKRKNKLASKSRSANRK